MRIIEATVTWKSEDEGCLEVPCSGLRPHFSVGGDLITSGVYAYEDIMERSKSYEVEIELPYGEIYDSELISGLNFRLQAGARVIAEGTIIRVR